MMKIEPGSPLYNALKKSLGATVSEDDVENPGSTLIRTDIDRARAVLRDHARDWRVPNPFGANDLIKPRRRGAWKESLGICLVLRTYDLVEVVGAQGWINRHDMRILALRDDGAAEEIAVYSKDFQLVEKAP